MKLLLQKLRISIDHLMCLDRIFKENHEEYIRIESIFHNEPFSQVYEDISKELYAGGKQLRGAKKLSRQMILGDVIEYMFTGRAYYYATKSEQQFKDFLRLILYCVNQLLIFDSITVNPRIRTLYIEALEENLDRTVLYEKPGDQELAEELKNNNTVLHDNNWKKFDMFVDSVLPKTLGCPKELIVFAELIRLKKGIVIPLLLIQRVFSEREPITPPDFLLAMGNKEIYGIEVGYAKEGQCREFSIRTSIPTFAVDLENNMHNRCPKCGEFILYCDPVIDAYVNETLNEQIDIDSKRFLCHSCPNFNEGNCKFSNYYGYRNGITFNGNQDGSGTRHYHASCVLGDNYQYRGRNRSISDHINQFFAQIPKIQGLENL